MEAAAMKKDIELIAALMMTLAVVNTCKGAEEAKPRTSCRAQDECYEAFYQPE
jgi:hypothetical protein